jgi:hypothetical protein
MCVTALNNGGGEGGGKGKRQTEKKERKPRWKVIGNLIVKKSHSQKNTAV